MNRCPFIHIRPSLAESKDVADPVCCAYTGFLFRCSLKPFTNPHRRGHGPCVYPYRMTRGV